MTGENSYIYALRNGAVEISFAEGPNRGMHFIDIPLPDNHRDELPIVSVERHNCRLDTYDATLHIADADVFTMTYYVQGPVKGYVSRSSYRRLEPSE